MTHNRNTNHDPFATTDRSVHGAVERNGLEFAKDFHADMHERDCGVRLEWTDPRIKRVVRLRLLSDPGFPAWDVSYCWAELHDGHTARLDLPFDQLPKYRGSISSHIVRYAIKDGVHAKRLGILDCISTLN